MPFNNLTKRPSWAHKHIITNYRISNHINIDVKIKIYSQMWWQIDKYILYVDAEPWTSIDNKLSIFTLGGLDAAKKWIYMQSDWLGHQRPKVLRSAAPVTHAISIEYILGRIRLLNRRYSFATRTVEPLRSQLISAYDLTFWCDLYSRYIKQIL